MSFHSSYEKWQRLTQVENCPVCNAQPMPQGMLDIVELPHSWLSAEPIECLNGACHLIVKTHVVELYELDEQELLSLVRDLQLCARALHKVTGAVKINYEIHGNTVPHLHVHLYPRYRDDPFAGQAIDYTQKQRWYTDAEFDSFVASMRQEIALG